MCETCTGPDTCTSCKEAPGLALNLETNICECNTESYIDNGGNNAASKCK